MSANQCYIALGFSQVSYCIIHNFSQVNCTVTNEKGFCIFIRIHIMLDELGKRETEGQNKTNFLQ